MKPLAEYTAAEIAALPAARETDALVALEAGYRWLRYQSVLGPRRYLAPPDVLSGPSAERWSESDGTEITDAPHYFDPRYPLHYSAQSEHVLPLAVTLDGVSFRLDYLPALAPTPWRSCFRRELRIVEVRAETPALAVCRGYLLWRRP